MVWDLEWHTFCFKTIFKVLLLFSDQYVINFNYLHFTGVLDYQCEPRHDKIKRVSVRPSKTQISLGIRPVWSQSSLSTWRKLRSLATHWAHSEDSDQAGWMPRLIWVFAGRTLILLVLSCGGCFWSLCWSHCFIWAAPWEKLSSGFPTR